MSGLSHKHSSTISIHALREEGDTAYPNFDKFRDISIHALREEGDARAEHQQRRVDISIHALREEGDNDGLKDYGNVKTFLSTPSARRATLTAAGIAALIVISIHALREEGDPRWFSEGDGCESISIHALREEGDVAGADPGRHFWNFYPRPPRGGRQQKQRQNLYFQTNYTTFCTNLEEP